MPTSFEPVFMRLRAQLLAHQGNYAITEDSKTLFGLEARFGRATSKAKGGKARVLSMPVAWVEKRKSYVSYHLMGIYMNPKLQATLSEPLRKHMQGKACFNFKNIDEPLFRELDRITGESLAALKQAEVLMKNNSPVA